jgi:hypothetical protein
LLRAGTLLCGLLAGKAGAEEDRWTELAEIAASSLSPAAQVAIDLDSIRWRRKHLEIWERTRYQPLTRQTRYGTMVRNFPETRTLWAIRCPQRAIAIVALSSEGTFLPREERLNYQVPAPGSPGAMIVEKLCDEMKLRPPEEVGPARPVADDPARRKWLLELPPTLANDDDD